MPSSDPSRLTAAQLELMNVLWEHRECSVTFLWERLAETRAVARNTVLTTVQRLVQRGFVAARRVGRADLYRARVQRETTARGRVRDLVDQVFGGLAERLVHSVLGDGMLDRAEIARLRRALDAAERDGEEVSR